ncbi:hypothetical protein C3L33_02393, partial [Rhododendron williamsianum]
MAASVYWLKFPCRLRPMASFRGLLFVPTSLALLAAVLIFFCISSTSRLMINLHQNNDDHLDVNDATAKQMIQISLPEPTRSSVLELRMFQPKVITKPRTTIQRKELRVNCRKKFQPPQQLSNPNRSSVPKIQISIVTVEEDDDAPDTWVFNFTYETQQKFSVPEIQIFEITVEVDDEATDTLDDDRREDSDQNQLPEESPVVEDEAHDASDPRRRELRTNCQKKVYPLEQMMKPLMPWTIERKEFVVKKFQRKSSRCNSFVHEFQISNITVEVVEEAHDALDNRREGTQSQSSEESSDSPIVEVVDEAPDALDNSRKGTQSELPEKSRATPIAPRPLANVLLPVTSEPGGNYASESYFKKSLMKSHFITKDPSKADFFFLPFSITGMRNDKRIGVGGMQDYVRDYVSNVRQKYPYWNRTGGADHFYVACHSIGKIAMGKAEEVKNNAIQVVCSSNYFVNGKRLAFFAGASNSPPRQYLVKTWRNDSEIFAHAGRLKTPYETEFLRSKFCFHVKGFEVNTARIGDAMYYGCVPVILADHYDLPFGDILNWKSFSVVVETRDIPLMKSILKASGIRVLRLQRMLRRTGGADHFYVACHSIGKIAMGKAEEVQNNAIQVKQQQPSSRKPSTRGPMVQISLPESAASSVLGFDVPNDHSAKGDYEVPDATDNRTEGTRLPEGVSTPPIVEVEDHKAPRTSEASKRREETESRMPEESPVASIVEVDDESPDTLDNRREETQSQLPEESLDAPIGISLNDDNDVYHDTDLFFEHYKEMNRSLKIYVYPHSPNETFANVLLPVSYEPGGNYASESYFKKALMKSHFVTEDPSDADFFFLPFSITGMRFDKRINVGGIQTMGKAAEVKDNAIQVVCSSNYAADAYLPHKDVSLPQIWPRKANPPQDEPPK